MNRKSLFSKLLVVLFFCLSTFTAVSPGSAAMPANRCKDRCKVIYRHRKHECRYLRKYQRHRCEDRAKYARDVCRLRCR
jgi:hypothetical protein